MLTSKSSSTSKILDPRLCFAVKASMVVRLPANIFPSRARQPEVHDCSLAQLDLKCALRRPTARSDHEPWKGLSPCLCRYPLVVKNGSVALASVASLMPTPVSAMLIRT